jgi:prepilin-type processing-associated H-X9-DG protein
MESNPLSELYDYSVAFSDIKNKQAVQYPIAFMSCSSTPGGPIADPKFKTGSSGWGSIGSDYAGSTGVASGQWTSHISYAKPAPDTGFFSDSVKTAGGRGLGVKNILDGTSRTVAVFESAGRPQVWYAGRMVPGSGQNVAGSEYVPVSSWANINAFAVRGYSIDLSQTNPTDQYDDPGPLMINGCNFYSMYAFHPGVANVLFVDGSTRPLPESTSCDVVASILTIAGGEMVPLP